MSKALYTLEAGVPGVRFATKADEPQIVGLLMLLHAENALFSLSPNKMIDGVRAATERRGGVIFVVETDNRIVATLGLSLACEWYSDDIYLHERWNFVHPEYRRSDYARKLLEQGKWSSEWFKAQSNKPMPFLCGINSFERTEAKIRLYARHMPCIGAFFMYGVAPRQPKQVQEEMRRIEEMNRKASRERTKEVRPAVETILHLSAGQ